MARGYLGKISAIVSANTGNYVRGLDESARRTTAFARSIQSDLNRASREASKSIDSILTPLQRFERAIQNAASARLRFRGVDVAVRTVEDLRRALSSLDDDTDKEFAVRVSGLRNITELKRALTDIREEDIDLALNVGGVEGLRRLRADIQEVNGQQVNIRTERTAEQLDVLIEKFSRLSPERIRQIAVRVESRQLDAAILKERQLISLSREIAAPLAAASAQFDKLTLEVQAGFIPALRAAQNRVEAVRDRIEAGGQVGQRAFRRIAEEVRLTTNAIERLAEAQRLVQSIRGGSGLRDASPRQFDALTRAAEQSRRSESLSAQVGSQFGIGDRQRRVSAAADSLQRETSRREAQEAQLANARRQGNTEEETRLQRAVQLTLQAEQRKTRELERQSAALDRQLTQAEQFEAAQRTSASTPFASFRDPTGRSIQDRVLDQAIAREERERKADLEDDQRRRREVASTLLPPVIDFPAGESTPFASFRDPTGRTIQERIRQQAAVRQAEERRQELEADQQRRREVATTLLPPVIDRPPPEFGDAVNSSTRRLGVLKDSIASVKGQIEQLPIPIQARFVPSLAEAIAQFQRLRSSGAATAEQIAAAAASVSQLRSQVVAAARASELFGTTFRDFADAGNVRSAAAGLEFLRGELLRATGSTREAERALDDYAEALQRAASTPGGFESQRVELDRLRQTAVESIAASEGVDRSPGQINRRLERVGDVARGSFGGAGLAVQQLVFAVDDFFSVTGDLDQRIRAAGNNISQLGFILGGTAGLFAGVAVSIAGQGVAALIKWARAGVGAADTTKALNDAIERQKTLVEQLAESFDNAADAIAGITLSEPAQQARSLREELNRVAEQQRELVVARVADLDPEVIRQRSIQRARQRDIDGSANVDQIARLQRELSQAQAREREQLESIRTRGERGGLASREIRLAASLDPQVLPDSRGEGARLFGALSGFFEQQARAENPLLLRPGVAVAGRRLASQELNRISGLGTIEQIGAFRQVQRQAEQQRFRGEIDQTTADTIIGAVESIVQKLEFQANLEFERVATEIRRSAQGFAFAIDGAGQDAADGIRRGVAGAADFQAALDNTGLQLEKLFTDLNAARQITNPEARQRELQRVQSRIDDVVRRQDAISESAREVRLGRTFGGERTTVALSAIQGNERFASELARLQAALAAAIDAEVQARRNLDAAIASGSDALQETAREELRAAQAASDLAAAAGEAAVALEGAFSRIRQSANDIEGGFRSIADQAQRDLAERLPVSDGGLPESQLRANRDAAELDLISATRRVQELQNRLDQERVSIGEDPRVREIDRRAEELRSQAQEAAARAGIDGVQEDPASARARADELAGLEEERARITFDSTAATRAAIDAEQQLVEDRRRAAEEARRAREFEVDRSRRRSPVGDPFAGLDSLESQRAATDRQFSQTIANINAAADLIAQNIIDAANGLPDAGQNEELRQNEAARQRALNQVSNEQLQSILQTTNALQRFEEALNEASQQVLAEARQAEARATEARRRQQFLSTPINDFEARNAEVNARRQRDLADQAQLAINQERSRLQEQARQGVGPIAGLVQELSRIDEALASAQGDDRTRLEAERRRVQSDIDRQVELSPEVRRARDAANREADRQAAAAQGRQIFLQQNPLLGAQQSLAEQFAAIDAAFEEFARGIIDAAGGLPGVDARVQGQLDANERRRQKARDRAIEDITDLGLNEREQARKRVQEQLGPLEAQAQALVAQGNAAEARRRLLNGQQNLAQAAAPLIFGFKDAVANAVLQGPSRAALQVSDTSTAEGQRELNRLLRGDDPARDVNLLELQKQSEQLKQINIDIKQIAARVGIVL